jgi:hypothetical protein
MVIAAKGVEIFWNSIHEDIHLFFRIQFTFPSNLVTHFNRILSCGFIKLYHQRRILSYGMWRRVGMLAFLVFLSWRSRQFGILKVDKLLPDNPSSQSPQWETKIWHLVVCFIDLYDIGLYCWTKSHILYVHFVSVI